MINGDLLVKLLVMEYAIIAIAYACQKDWSRLTYWIGAIVLNIGFLTMK
jgi:hypothetical protein